ncbi:hypothetical protein MNBD_GAMMA16-1870 [hydrothermal vent metagenome]|uniref:Uncharacterized protein n=1 Tax=hydrothermal vent metagenome TaxID=652676 RepID=A0A3B0ZEF4_9ZZZZ
MLTNIDATTVYDDTTEKHSEKLDPPRENITARHDLSRAKVRLNIVEKEKSKIPLNFVIGLLLMAMLVSQYFYPVTFSELNNLQSNELYRQLSGFAILLFTLHQWRLTHHRNTKQNGKIKQSLQTHQWVGIVAPILIYLHTVETGYAYQTALLFSYIALITIGLCNYHVIKVRKKWYVNSWLALHISLATLSLTLISYHIYIVYTYT